jgi:hypothetical protein
MRTTTILIAFAVLALFAVANGNTAAIPEATGSPSTLSIYSLDVGHPNMKNLPVQEIPLP